MNETLATISNHRSIRSFRPEPLPPGTVRMLVETGVRASTSSNMQACAVIHVDDPILKPQLAKLCADQKQIHESAAFLAFCADLHRLSVACELRGADAGAVGEAEALVMAVVDVALVMQNVAIAAESLGFGICMIGAIRNNPREVRDLLHLPPGVMGISGMCIGVPNESPDRKPRFPVGATLHANRYPAREEVERNIADYDRIQSEWYAERGMHERDTRWSAVMAKRITKMGDRTDVGVCLREQGFLSGMTER